MARSLDVNLLRVRDRLGQSLVEVVAADFAEHGAAVIAALRAKNPAVYARVAADLVHFKKLANPRVPPPKRKPRPQRMKDLVKEMARKPVKASVPPGLDPNALAVRLVEACKRLEPRRPQDLSAAELDAALGAELAAYWREKVRVRRSAPSAAAGEASPR